MSMFFSRNGQVFLCKKCLISPKKSITEAGWLSARFSGIFNSEKISLKCRFTPSGSAKQGDLFYIKFTFNFRYRDIRS